MRHVETQWLWIQGVFHRREATIRKIPGVTNEADLMTKFLDGASITSVMKRMGFQFLSGRSGLALKATLDTG